MSVFPDNSGVAEGGLVGSIIDLGRRMRAAGAGTTIGQTLAAVEGLRLIEIARPEDFRDLLCILENAGYGWLRPEGVRKRLDELS